MTRAALVLLALSAACGTGASPREAELSWPAPPAVDELDGAAVATIFATARARFWPDEPAPPIPAVATRELYLCAYGPWTGAHCERGEGADLRASATAAIAALANRRGPTIAAAGADGVRFKLDAITASVPAPMAERILVEELGLIGLAGPGGGFLLPSEFLELDLAKPRTGEVRMNRLASAMRDSGRGQAPAPGEAVSWFQSKSWVEAADGDPVRLYRVHPHQRPEVDDALLLARARLAADHLADITGADGTIRYHYRVARDRSEDDYNWLRHAGSIYALLTAYQRLDQPATYRDAAVRAIERLLAQSQRGRRHGPFGGGPARFVVSPRSTGPTLKLGGSALALLAIATWQQVTGDQRWLSEARELGRFLIAAQKRTGEFHSYLALEPGDEVPDRVSLYYPGEATLALVELYEIDPDPAWLEAARRGADWLIHVRDAGKQPAELATDHWLMLALTGLYRETRDDKYVAHTLALAESVLPNFRKGLEMAKRYPDYAGGFYSPPRSTPAATRSEGLVAALDTCRLARRTDCDWIRGVLITTVEHQLLCQYTDDTVYWVPRPDRAVGGFMGGIVDTSIRNDFVQHNLSALLGLERQL